MTMPLAKRKIEYAIENNYLLENLCVSNLIGKFPYFASLGENKIMGEIKEFKQFAGHGNFSYGYLAVIV